MPYKLSYLLFITIPLILGLYAQFRIIRTYENYKNINNSLKMSAEQIARELLLQNGIYDVSVKETSGMLTDHYNPISKTIALSQEVYHSQSISAIGIAAHEVGHVLQYTDNYFAIKVRMAILPITDFGSKTAVPLILMGLLFQNVYLAYFGLFGFLIISLFQLVTLPVEFDASNRALNQLANLSLPEVEQEEVKAVLSSAAMTYVASLFASVGQLLHLILVITRRNRK